MAMADPISNSTSRNERGLVVLCVCIVFGIVQTLAVALRFAARRQMKARWRIDDWLIFASLWPNYVMIVLGGFCTHPSTNRRWTRADLNSGGRGQSWVADRLSYSSTDGCPP